MARNRLPSRPPLALDGDLDVFSAQRQLEKILAHLEAGEGPVRLDLSSIQDLDLSGMQLICALGSHLEAEGVSLSLSGVPEAWEPRLRLLGMAAAFHGGDR